MAYVQHFTTHMGWLSPSGILSECEDFGHYRCAIEMGKGEDELEYELGYIHVGYAGGVRSENAPTQAQLNALWDIWSSDFCPELLKIEIEGYCRRMGCPLVLA